MERVELNTLYNRWRGNRTLMEMFNFIFNENGYKCKEFFHSCWTGAYVLDCCKVFEPTYVMLRGRCFRLINNYNQHDVDEIGKLTVFLNTVPNVLEQKRSQPQVIMYISDSHPEIGINPRFYLDYHNWNRVRLTQQRISMLSDNPLCTENPLNQGKSTCFVYNWIRDVLLTPLNCTLPYFKGMLSYLDNATVCDTSIVINDYYRITSSIRKNYNCLVACERTVNEMQMLTSQDFTHNISYSFRLEISFGDLQYQHYSESRLTTAAGFISELGGQSGLFIGCSVMSVIQLVFSVLLIISACAQKIYKRCLSLLISSKACIVMSDIHNMW
ncbi:hypothetical protein DICVIV_12110 [Dictyocaulus viviparus]|uniref:Amiloride-sensitive sodium channel n=1 Tax=Dictyocaulus viviparus TaxID=29172 RepID=A0A0D8XHU0_DICVI|nr:hypothetical protein DICVIV_12110 [Dictyocaulus viviparus]